MLGACGIECADGAEQQVVDTDVLPPEYLADLYQKKDADPDAGVDLPITWGPVPPIQASPASVATGPGTGYWTDEGGEELTRLPCGHSFHGECISEWLLNYSKACPCCKVEVGR